MGRTLPSITQVFLQEQEVLARFRRGLRRSDQLVFDELLVAARRHLAAAAYASHLTPLEIFFLSMLIEEHKEIMRLERRLEELKDPNG
jgi:DNA-binding response OmpR family regulator